MAYRIFKYEIEPGNNHGYSTVAMPRGSQLLHVDAIDGRLFVWAKVGDSSSLPVRFKVIGTGHEFDGGGYTHIGTAIMRELGLVWHVFAESRWTGA